jgi:putative oxidoreductase
MHLIRRLARPLLAAIFIYGGWDAFRNPEGKAPKADKVAGGVPSSVPGMSNTTQLVRVDGAAKMLGGAALAIGKLPRLAALGLAASLVPTTLAGHRFWEETDPAKRQAQQLQFVKNLSILGGILLAAVDTDGKPSLGWRAHRLARHASAGAHAAAASAHSSSGALTGAVTDAVLQGSHAVADTVRHLVPATD